MAQNDYSFLPFGAGGIPANENSGTSLPAPRWYSGTAAPTAGTYNAGDFVFNVTPSAQSGNTAPVIGWVCSAGGAPGTWITLNAPANPAAPITTTATSGTLTGGASLTLLNPASTGTYTLPDASASTPGLVIRFKNIASGSVTLTPSGANNYADASAITLAQFGVVNLASVGTTTWYKAA